MPKPMTHSEMEHLGETTRPYLARMPLITGILTVQWFPDSVFLDPIDECLAAYIEVTRRMGLIPIAPVQGPQDELFFNSVQTYALRWQVYLKRVDAGFLLPQELW